MSDFPNKKRTRPTVRCTVSLILLMLAFLVSNLNMVLLIDGTHIRMFNRLLSLVFLLAWQFFLYTSFKEKGKRRLNFHLYFWLSNLIYFVLLFGSGAMGPLGNALLPLLFPLTVIFFIPMAGFGPTFWVYFLLCIFMLALGLIAKKNRNK